MNSVPQRKRPRSYWNNPTSDLPRASLFESQSYFLLGPVGTLIMGVSDNLELLDHSIQVRGIHARAGAACTTGTMRAWRWPRRPQSRVAVLRPGRFRHRMTLLALLTGSGGGQELPEGSAQRRPCLISTRADCGFIASALEPNPRATQQTQHARRVASEQP